MSLNGRWWVAAILIFMLTGCASTPPSPAGQTADGLMVVATTTIVGDVVAQIGGEAINLVVLLPVGTDPHSFQPTPQDMAHVADAQVIFLNGAGLEPFLEKLIDNSGSQARQVVVSTGITFLVPVAADEHDLAQGATSQDPLASDPHVWMDPNHVLVWVDNIEQALVDLDPANSLLYQQNASRYREALIGLDAWITDQVGQIPPENRELVTDHQVFTYFAQRYGFNQVGTIIPSTSTLAEPSAQELAALENAIRELSVKAVFVGNTVNPALATRVAQDTGVALIPFYTGSLTDASGPAATYLDYMRFNVNAIVSALK